MGTCEFIILFSPLSYMLEIFTKKDKGKNSLSLKLFCIEGTMLVRIYIYIYIYSVLVKIKTDSYHYP